MKKRTLHLVPLLAVTIEEPQVQPGAGAAMARINGSVILIFGDGEILVLFGEAGLYPCRPRGIKFHQRVCLLFSFVAPAPDNARRLQLELSQIAAGVHTFRIQMHCSFEFLATTL